ncbi:outer membrane protein assembly factor BamB family protein [Natrialba aegyptia]|uniref:Pyrrolo-quinoline quinone n=1 Tax=Natrialba aegyptia DSM 13077 TaxID=1227491 RepID=M0B7I3_9EURY|nr:PQQ-binding-like beta-propeller repeat protein [Natrialba aegyptia]ELZ06876.1 Pyrrolo-quinoline quinone [Natrialba aegyptia DSM 13077]
MDEFTRRGVLRAVGAAGAVGTVAVAGCLDASADGSPKGDDGIDKDDDYDEIAWRYDTGGSVETVRDGILYGQEDFVDGTGGVLALDAATGEPEWRFGRTGGYSSYTAPVVDEFVYTGYGDDAIGSGSGSVYALDDDGTERWTGETGSVYHRPRLADGLLVVGSDDGAVRGFDRDSGDERWTVSVEGEDAGEPAPTSPTVETVADGVAYVTDDETLYAFDLANGDERWRYDAENRLSSLTVTDTVYFTTRDCVGAISVDGTERWTIELDSVKRLRAVVRGTVFVVRGDDLFAIDAADGTERWSDEPDAGADTDRTIRIAAGAETDGDERIYIASDADSDSDPATLRALALDGDERWSTALGDVKESTKPEAKTETEPRSISTADGSVYVVTADAIHRYAFGGENHSAVPIADIWSHAVGELAYVGTRDAVYGLRF